MGAITDLWRSERGLLAVLIIIAASVFVAIGKMPVASWETFVMVIFGTYAAGKTITTAVETIKGPAPQPAPAPAPPVNP